MSSLGSLHKGTQDFETIEIYKGYDFLIALLLLKEFVELKSRGIGIVETAELADFSSKLSFVLWYRLDLDYNFDSMMKKQFIV